MVNLLHGMCKDVVCVIPIDRLDVNILRFWLNKAMVTLEKYLTVVAISVDNHICNR